MNKQKLFLLFSFLLCLHCSVFAGKPRWVGNTPKEMNGTYRFIEVIAYGNTIENARMNALQQLAQDEQLRRAVMVNIESGQLTDVQQHYTNGNLTENIDNRLTVNMKVSGQEYRLQAQLVDEYVASYYNGKTQLHVLYMVAVNNSPQFDRAYLTTDYGIMPAVMSVIPGVGQFYKGNIVKGGILMGSVASLGIGALLCENQRSSYRNKINQNPEFAQQYSTKASNWQTGRNICLGAAAAIWVYNIIDAATSKGARKVIVKQRRGGDFSISPVISPMANGITLSYRF